MTEIQSSAADIDAKLLAAQGELGVDMRPKQGQVSLGRQMWWRFRKNKAALAGLVIVAFIYLVAVFADILAPAGPDTFNAKFSYAPPQSVQWMWQEEDGSWSFRPHVLGYATVNDPVTFTRKLSADPENRQPIVLFPQVAPYKVFGFVPMQHALFGLEDRAQPFFLMGSDRIGRDMLSRMIHGARISMSVGFVGVVFSVTIGLLLGGISGYFGGITDTVVQRVIEFIISIPTIPLWLALAAALPKTWDPLLVYLMITLILGLVGWTEMARVVRGRIMSLKHEDYVAAARLDGVPEMRLIIRHMLPALTSHIIASASLAIPATILAETALSFLGLGLQPPIVSWGVMLQDAQSVRALASAPWLLTPGVAVMIAVLALNFLGDGLRDAADPYS